MADNPAAFPSFETREQYKDDEWYTVLDSHGGMKLRDYFAAAVAPAFAREFLAAGDAWDAYDDIAVSIYSFADAILRERERRINNGV